MAAVWRQTGWARKCDAHWWGCCDGWVVKLKYRNQVATVIILRRMVSECLWYSYLHTQSSPISKRSQFSKFSEKSSRSDRNEAKYQRSPPNSDPETSLRRSYHDLWTAWRSAHRDCSPFWSDERGAGHSDGAAQSSLWKLSSDSVNQLGAIHKACWHLENMEIKTNKFPITELYNY